METECSRPTDAAVATAARKLEPLVCDVRNSARILFLLIDRLEDDNANDLKRDQVDFMVSDLEARIGELHGAFYDALDGIAAK